jgi:phosphoglycolate phosphatase
MRPYNVVLFDLDGTLTDPGEGITKSVAYALKKFGIEIEDLTSLYKFIGPPLADSFMKYFSFTREEAFTAVDYYREYYSVTGIFQNIMYEGIDSLLQALFNHGIQIVLATSKPKVFAEKILDEFKISKYFKYISGSELDGTHVNKDEVIADALSACGIASSEGLIMVGDREYDVLGAKKHGIDSVGVLFGYGSREELKSAGATYIAETVQDIGRIILG